MKKCVFPLLWGLVLAGSAVAQDEMAPALLVKDKDGKVAPLRVDDMEVSVKVVGNIAETLITLRFRNDTDRVLEGELVFPLGEGKSVSRYALEVNGKMREGVSIPKDVGKSVFESVVRSQVDPGLLEWTKGNNFRTRIYPIPAKGFKSVRIGYEEELSEVGDHYQYLLPLDFPGPLARFHLKVEAARPAGAGAEGIRAVGGPEVAAHDHGAWVMEIDEKDFAASEDLAVQIPREDHPTVVVEESGGERFFYVLDRPVVPEEGRARPRPKSIRLVWDVSASGGERNHEKELELLEHYLQWVGDAQVNLVLLRHVLEEGGSFAVVAGEWAALRATIEAVRYDGGTRFDRLDLREGSEEAVLLVTDGVSSLGGGDPKPGSAPVFVLQAAPSAEHGLLRRMAIDSGGAYANLAVVSAKAAVGGMTEHRFSLLKAEVEKGEQVHPSTAHPVSGAVAVAGKLMTNDPVSLTLHYGWGEEVQSTKTIVIDPGKHRAELDRVSRLWAQKKLADLEVDPKRNRAEITELAREHGLVTRFTSLIVLDRIEDYVAHGIVPPEPEMRAEYERLLKEQEDDGAPGEDHLKNMLVLWEERCGWHDQRFPDLGELLFTRLELLQPMVRDAQKRFRKLARDEGKEQGGASAIREVVDKLAAEHAALRELQAVPVAQRDEGWLDTRARLTNGVRAALSQFDRQFAEAPAATVVAREVAGRGEVRAELPPPPAGASPLRVHLYRAEGYTNLGLFDQAMQEYLGALRVDASNKEARRGMERVRAMQSDYYRAAYDETRAQLLARVDEAWAGGAGGAIGDELFVGGGTAGGEGGRTSADFISPVAFATIPGIPAGQEEALSRVTTAGNRSGDSAITRHSIDAILNNPNRSAELPGSDPAVQSITGLMDPVPSPGLFPQTPSTPAPAPVPKEDSPVVKALREAPAGADLEGIYFDWKGQDDHGRNPDFYLDAAEFFLSRGDRELGVRILGNIAEIDPEDAVLLRIVAYRFFQLGFLGEAESIFREVKSLRGFEPQSWRDLALVLAKQGNAQEAVDLMWQAVTQPWDSRFEEVQMTILNELNALVVRHETPLDLSSIDSRFLRNLDCDLRVVLTWSSNDTDVDLWVTGPAGEKCYYEHRRTASGGRISPDCTAGYGPEEFMIRKALDGEYEIAADYYGNHRQTLAKSTTLQVEIFTNWGRPNQSSQTKTLRLDREADLLKLGAVEFPDE